MTDLKQGGCKMKQCMDADNLHRRLKKIIGQVQAIDRMGGLGCAVRGYPGADQGGKIGTS